jgi:hypothetical protein
LFKYPRINAKPISFLDKHCVERFMIEVKEKDNYWLYVAGLVLAVIAVVVAIRGNEHGKYESSAKAIAEDSANSAYKNSKL